MRFRFPLAACILAVGLSTTVSAHEFKVGALSIEHPYSFATAPGARTGAGYMTLRNDGSEADRLIEVRAAFPMVQIHMTEVDDGGVARMMQLEGVEIPPGTEVILAPAGNHVMFMGLPDPLVEGGEIAATLVFEKAGEVAVSFSIEARGEASSHEHGGH